MIERKSTIFTNNPKYASVWSSMPKREVLHVLKDAQDHEIIEFPLLPGGATEEKWVAFRRDQILGVEDY